MEKNLPETDIETLKAEILLPEKAEGETLNDLTIRLIGIPFFGLAIPNASGLISSKLYSLPQLLVYHLYFIFIAFCIWQGNRFLLFKLRERHSWLNNPFQKIVSLFLSNLLYTAPLTIGLCWLWYVFMAKEAINWNIIISVTLVCVICVIFITHVYEMVFLARKWEANKQINEKLQVTLNKFMIINNVPAPLPQLEQKTAYKTRLMVKKGNDSMYLNCTAIGYFYTVEKVVFAIDVQGERYLVDRPLGELETLLNPSDFFRINRQYLVNISAVQKFKSSYKGKLNVKVAHCSDELTVSQENAQDFKNWVEQ